MRLQILDKETEGQLAELLSTIKLRKNGVTADAMSKAGIQYKMNYGVSVVHLKEMATRFKGRGKLVEALWNVGWRETMILSTMIFDVDNADIDMLDRMAASAHTEELYQQLGMNVLVNLKDFKAKAIAYLNSQTVNKKIVACYALTRYFILHKQDVDFADEVTATFLRSKPLADHNWSEINALAKALSRAGFVSSEDNSVILEYFTSRTSIHRFWEIAAEAVRTEFDYR